MSSFSNILSSLGGTQQSAPAASQGNAASKPRPAAPPRVPSYPLQPATAGVKRKHDDGLTALPPAKAPSQLPHTAANGKPAPRPANHERPPLPALVKPSSQAAQTSARPSTPLSAAGKVPPKNSYQALLARAQTAQVKRPEFGQIKHKPVQKPPRQIRSQTPEQGVKAKSPNSVRRSPSSQSAKKGRPSAVLAGASTLGVKTKRKPLELDYKGTMRPSAATATRKSSSTSPANAISRPKPPATGSSTRLPERSAQRLKPSQQRYSFKAESDVEEEDYEEDASDSDSMRGGGFDELMEEEEASARAARKEDAEELRYETELKRQKAEKKKAMERFQTARKGKTEG